MIRSPQTEQTLPWILEARVNDPLSVVNLYRKVFMSDLKATKLVVSTYYTDDSFLIREFIDQRVSQIPINQTISNQAELTLEVHNKLDQEMCITTDHIRIKGRSARQTLQLCDHYLICKLGVGKKMQMSFKFNQEKPVNNDIYRLGLFIATDPSPDEGSMHLKHTRESSICKLTSFGMLTKEQFKSSLLISKEFENIIEENISGVSVQVQKDPLGIEPNSVSVQIQFGTFPHYVLDPVLCILIQELKKSHTQIQINLPNNQIVCVTTHQITMQSIQHIEKITINAIYQLLADLKKLEQTLQSQVQ